MFVRNWILVLISVLALSTAWGKEVRMIDQLEKIFVNGSHQFILCRGEDISKPVVLFVHGGPASPLMLFARAFDDTFLKDFIIVHWDQRDSGKSFDPKGSISNFSLKQVSEDGLVVVDHLKKKFNQRQIILVGHSWGSIVGAAMVNAKADDFLAYISVGTVADMARGDSIKYEFLNQQVGLSGDQTDKADLKKLGPPPWTNFPQLVIQSRLMTKYKGSFFGLTREQINAAVEKNREYSPTEMENLDVSMDKVWKHISAFLFSYIAIQTVPQMNVPVLFVQGAHDMATPTTLAKKYFEKLNAPKGKEWVEFSSSAHFPMYEEPKAFLSLLQRASRY